MHQNIFFYLPFFMFSTHMQQIFVKNAKSHFVVMCSNNVSLSSHFSLLCYQIYLYDNRVGLLLKYMP